MKWTEMTPQQRDALIAETIMGWRWVEVNHRDVSRVKHQVWLLPPDVHSVSEVVPGEWGYCIDIPDDPLYVDSAKLIQLNLLPHYTTDMNAAWLVLQKICPLYFEAEAKGVWDETDPFYPEWVKACRIGNTFFEYLIEKADGEIYPGHTVFNDIVKWTPDRIAWAACKAYGLLEDE